MGWWWWRSTIQVAKRGNGPRACEAYLDLDNVLGTKISNSLVDNPKAIVSNISRIGVGAFVGTETVKNLGIEQR
jgi:hypothetical protein